MKQNKVLIKGLYHSKNIDETSYSKKAFEREEKLSKAKILLKEGCSKDIVFEALDMSKASYYRWKKRYKEEGLGGLVDQSRRPDKVRAPVWNTVIKQRIYHLRKEYPLWGKQKIAVIYKRKYKESISESTVGRILSLLIYQNKVMPVSFLYGKKDKKRRLFNGHAKRWNKSMKAKTPGELVQVDHMTVDMPGIGTVKHFSAICPVSKMVVYRAYTRATSTNAKQFLEHMKEKLPFPIKSIQVDGGSEFMSDFEKACMKSKIPLFVLPPRSPEYNGNVERANCTAKYEFYAQYDSHPSFYVLRKRLSEFVDFYNSYRPHQGINLLTPNQFYEVIRNETLQSHMY